MWVEGEPIRGYTDLFERKSKYLCAMRLSGKDADETRENAIRLLRKMNTGIITFDNGKDLSSMRKLAINLERRCTLHIRTVLGSAD